MPYTDSNSNPCSETAPYLRIRQLEEIAFNQARDLERVEKRRVYLERQLQAVLNTKSWRWTAFYRAAQRAWRKFKTRVFSIRLNVNILQGWLPPRFPVVPNPLVSIVIPVFGRAELTLACLDSIRAAYDEIPYEVIVVDDGSKDRTPKALLRIPGIRVLTNEKNLGFVRSTNQGAAEARGRYVLFLNNDTQVTSGWMKELVETFGRFPDTGLVGSKLVYPSGRLQEAGAIVRRDGRAANFGRGDDPEKPEYNYLREADYCSGAAVMVEKEFFLKLGGFDEAFSPAYGEDYDLAFRIRKAGKKVYYQPLSKVVHIEGGTAGTDLNRGVKRYQALHEPILWERWREDLQSHGPADSSLSEEKDRYLPRRMLSIDHLTPTPDQDSGSESNLNLMRLFRDLGYQVTFVNEDFRHDGRYTRALQRIGIECIYTPLDSSPMKDSHPAIDYTIPLAQSLEMYLERQGRRYDAVMISRAPVAARYLDSVRRHCPQARVIFNTVDLHFLREERRAQTSGDPEQLRSAQIRRGQELELMRKSDVTIVVSSAEKKILKQIDRELRVEWILPPREFDRTERPYSTRKDILFVGGFRHPPNIDAAVYLAQSIWPRISERLPDARLLILGSHPTPEIRVLASGERVEVIGPVPDLKPYFDQCRLSVAPVRYGAGVKMKIVTSIGFGVPVVSTSLGAEGSGLQNGQDLLVADDPEAFADAVVRLYSEEDLWNRLADTGHQKVSKLYSMDAIRSELSRLLDELDHPLPGPLGGLWTDRVNAPKLVEKKLSRGLLSPEDAEAFQHFIEHGYWILPGAVSADQVDACLRDVDAIYEGRTSPCFFEWFDTSYSLSHRHASKHIDPVLPEHRDLRGKLLDSYSVSDAFRSALFAPAIARFLSLLFEGPVLAFQGLSFERGSGQPLHQDTVYVRVRPHLNFAAAWIALEDTQEGSGALEYLSGSHRMPEYLFAGGSKWITNDQEYPAYFENLIRTGERLGLARKRFLAKKGDVLIWCSDLAHGGSPILDPSLTRKSFVAHYCPLNARPAYFETGPYARPIQWAEGLHYSYQERAFSRRPKPQPVLPSQ